MKRKPKDKKEALRSGFAQDQDTWFMALVAIRYCIGRSSYAPSLATYWVMRYWDIIPEQTKALLLRDVGKEIEDADRLGKPELLGHQCDQETWRYFHTWMQAKLRSQQAIA